MGEKISLTLQMRRIGPMMLTPRVSRTVDLFNWFEFFYLYCFYSMVRSFLSLCVIAIGYFLLLL